MYQAIFLDRDGVIVENRPNYIRSWAEVSIYPEALEALVRIRNSPYKIVIVTNQSVVGRGHISFSAAQAINYKLVEEIERAGGRVDGIFMCPHHPDEGCECRKPRPGLFLKAARSMSLNLSKSIVIGDALSDLVAGQSAGIRTMALVRTGRGVDQARLPNAVQLQPFPIFGTLGDALLGLTQMEDGGREQNPASSS